MRNGASKYPNLLHVLFVEEPGLVGDLFVDGVWVVKWQEHRAFPCGIHCCLLQGEQKPFNLHVRKAGWLPSNAPVCSRAQSGTAQSS